VFNFQIPGIDSTVELLFLDRAESNKCTLRNTGYCSVLLLSSVFIILDSHCSNKNTSFVMTLCIVSSIKLQMKYFRDDTVHCVIIYYLKLD
jgi:hypothetical protein